MYGKSKLLIADDMEINRIILTEIFKDEYEIIHAQNGLQALEIISKEYKYISILIVDIVMPIMNGFELLNILKVNPNYEKIVKIVVSGANDEENRQKAKEAGASDLIVKPFEPFMIKQKIKTIMTGIEAERLREENEKFKKYLSIRTKLEGLTDELQGGIIVFESKDMQTDSIKVLYTNKYLFDILGIDKELSDYYITNDTNLFFKEDVNNLIRLCIINKNLNKSDLKIENFRIKSADGNIRWFDISAKLLKDDGSNNSIIYFAMLFDVTDRVRKENEIAYKLKYDTLTDIYNKDLFYIKTQELLISNMHKNYVIICINVEKLKLINELYGINDGDNILKKIAKIIKMNFPSDTSTYGRLYSDYFAICTEKSNNYLDKITYLAQHGFDYYNINFKVNIKVGIYEVGNHTLSIQRMCDMAIMAIDEIRDDYRKIYNFFEEKMKNELILEQEIINDMNSALLNNQFEVYYQPKFNLITNKIIGAEALVRWNHPNKGQIEPNKFINTFEKTDFITYMDEYVIERVCCQIKEWIDMGIKPFPISINLSKKDIFRESFITIISSMVNKYHIPVELIHIEITESAYTENASLLSDTIKKLKNLGFTIEMDDFGDGYSSLNMLNEIPVDILKLDIKLLKNNKFEYENKNKKIMQSIIYMANLLKLDVIAEGVESKEQINNLLEIGCYIGQGFYFSKAVSASDFEKYLH